MIARFGGKCACGTKVIAGDEVRFASKKIVACAACTKMAHVELEPGDHLAWNWAFALGQDVDVLRSLYRALRKAYLGLAMRDSNSGIWGRHHSTAAEFDAAVSESMAREIKDWRGVDGFDRLTIAQLYCLHAAHLYHGAAQSKTVIEASPETLEWGGFLGGEIVSTSHDAFAAINAMVAKARG